MFLDFLLPRITTDKASEVSNSVRALIIMVLLLFFQFIPPPTSEFISAYMRNFQMIKISS